ncbi:MAG: YihY/virulence factor BrkB family protein [Thermoleophilaceae bacterium]|nr:YihY/virulence factor BrkB family protein [Thermoleophilaceae bacterium]
MSHIGRWLKVFYVKAYEDNLTGLSGMVAYNLLLSAFPFALVALFIASQVLGSAEVEDSVLADLQQLFPSATDSALNDALERLRDSSSRIGVLALIVSVWFGSSFWGALDTAFGQIYHVDSRSWVQQKRFSLGMLVVTIVFMAATVAVPALQSILVKGTADLPFGLSDVHGLVFALTLAAGLMLLFGILCVIYALVPKARVPWSAIWPGAFVATLAIGIVDYAFPAYLSNISTIAKFGTTFVFVLIVLIWFYALAIIMLGGAVVNAMRFESRVTDETEGEVGPPSAEPL